MAAFVMQTLGCEVAALNTVHYSMLTSFHSALLYCHAAMPMATNTHPWPGNHLGYRQSKGTKTSADDISDLYVGLKQSYLTDFDIMLTGYAPNAKAVDAIGAIGRDLKLKASTKPGSFFWGAIPSGSEALLSSPLTASST